MHSTLEDYKKASKIPEYVRPRIIRGLKKNQLKFNRPFNFLVDSN